MIKKRPKPAEEKKIFNKTAPILNRVKDTILFFTKRRYDFLLIIMAAGYYNLSYSLDETTRMLVKKDIQIAKLASYTTYITDTGIIKQYEKESFNVYSQKSVVAKTLCDYLVISAYSITDNYNKTFFESEEKLFKSTPLFMEFYKNFILIDPLISTESELKELEIGKNDWKMYLRWVRVAINDNNLPQIIDKKISNIEVTQWVTKDADFEITFKLPLYAKSRNKNNAIDEGMTQAVITAKGYYDLSQKTTVNAYGMKFYSFKISHPTINQDVRPK